MGMKANSGLYSNTTGNLRFKLDLQYFASKSISKKGTVTIDSLTKYGGELLDKSPTQISNVLKESTYETKVEFSKVKGSNAEKVVTLNLSKERNITQIQISQNGSSHHGNQPYVKVSTKDIGIIKIVKGNKSKYKTDGKEKAKVIFKRGKRNGI